jgi:hypothetical protein
LAEATIIKELTVSQLPAVFKSLRERRLALMSSMAKDSTDSICTDSADKHDLATNAKLNVLERSYNSICRIRDMLAMPAFHGTNGVSHYYEVRVLSPVFYMENAALDCHVLEDEHQLEKMLRTIKQIERHPP